MKRWVIVGYLILMLGCLAPAAAAAPYFFVSGDTSFTSGYLYHYSVYLYTGDDTVTVAQTVLNFDSAKVQNVNFSTLGSRCTFWAPADPSLGYGNQTTPYFYGGTKMVIACGFTGGYKSTGNNGDLIAKLLATPVTGASGTTTLSFSDTLFRYIGTPITPGTNVNLSLTVYESTAAANPTATPYPTPTTAGSIRTITVDDLNLMNLATRSATTTTSTSLSSSTATTQSLALLSPTLGISAEGSLDDTIPAPPAAFTPRPTDVPVQNEDEEKAAADDFSLGEVLSVQSLKELLLPGKSEADQRVVLVNLLSTLAFLVILAILIWRLIIVSRINRVKYRHLKDMLAGELSALEGKLSSEISETGRAELSKRIDEIRTELE